MPLPFQSSRALGVGLSIPELRTLADNEQPPVEFDPRITVDEDTRVTVGGDVRIVEE